MFEPERPWKVKNGSKTEHFFQAVGQMLDYSDLIFSLLKLTKLPLEKVQQLIISYSHGQRHRRG